MSNEVLDKAIAAVPGGPWAVGVSGGADSVALLGLLRKRKDVMCHVVHLDHDTREGESAIDARFVRDLCVKWRIEGTFVKRSDLEAIANHLPANLSARFRLLRHTVFRGVCERYGLAGVILAHHAGDQAETVFQRLVRGGSAAGLTGMRARKRLRGLTILRPLLGVAPEELRAFLREQNQTWREDSSNASPAYQRNRVRMVLAGREGLAESMRRLGESMAEVVEWLRGCAPRLKDGFDVRELADCPLMLASEAARRWLVESGVPRGEVSPGAIARLIEMASDAASPARGHFPGGVLVRRRGGRIFVGG